MQATANVASYRLFQLISPSLPIGGFTYSQGLEYAVEAGWVTNRDTMEQWLNYMANSSVATLELPIIDRLYLALEQGELDQIEYWCDFLYARAVKLANCARRRNNVVWLCLLCLSDWRLMFL